MRRFSLACLLSVAVTCFAVTLGGCDTGNRRAAQARTQNRERDGQKAEADCACDRDGTETDPFASDGQWAAPKRTIFETADTFNEEHREPRVASPSRPPSKGRIDLDLKGANLADALRFLASAGHFNLVIDDNLGSPVTVALKQVDAYDALVVIAESQGLEVDYSRGIVRVGAAKPATAATN